MYYPTQRVAPSIFTQLSYDDAEGPVENLVIITTKLASVSVRGKSRRFKTAYQNFIRKFNAQKIANTFISVSGPSARSSGQTAVK